jgi:hypothetical protein
MSSEDREDKRITRREFVRGAAVAGAAGVLASCGPTPAPQVVKETVEVPVEVEKIVEKTVEVPVEVTKIVEKVVEVPCEEAGPVTLEVHDPTGAFEVTQLFSPRLDTLEGKTICELYNGSWEGERTFPLIRELLQKMYPTVKFVTYDQLPMGTAAMTSEATKLGEVLKEAGCDAVITGNAG